MIHKSNKAYKSIGEVAKILNLVNKKKGTLNTHTIRFWEKKFKQIKPNVLNGNRRYYNNDTIEVLKKVKYLLKDQGMTINGAKKVLNSDKSLKLDELPNNSINANYSIKNHVKVRLVPEAKPDSPYFYYVKKPAGGEKAKVKLSAKKYNPATRKHELFVEKKLPPHSK
jgi:DNA-binding transcriptional MerR regulator